PAHSNEQSVLTAPALQLCGPVILSRHTQKPGHSVGNAPDHQHLSTDGCPLSACVLLYERCRKLGNFSLHNASVLCQTLRQQPTAPSCLQRVKVTKYEEWLSIVPQKVYQP
ncbi:hypothetical protein ABG768_019765, partial [Culter alburnus]